MATVTPLKSLMMFLILAWVIISWPFRMPPRRSPMMTSTIAISTKVKPASAEFFLLVAEKLMKFKYHSGVEIRPNPQDTCPRTSLGQAPKGGLDWLFVLNNGHLRRLSDTFHWFSPRSPAGRSCFQLFQALVKESQFGRVLDGPVLEVPPDDQAGGFQLVHVLEDEDLHLLRPEGNVVGDGVALDRPSVAERERQIVEPVLGDGGRMGEPGPATIGIEEELPIDELEHAALLGLDGHFGIQPARGEQGVLAARVQSQDPREPGFEPAIVEVAIGDLAAGLIVERLQVEHQRLGERHGIPEAREPQRRDARRGRQILRGHPRRWTTGLQPDLRGEPKRKQRKNENWNRRNRSL